MGGARGMRKLFDVVVVVDDDDDVEEGRERERRKKNTTEEEGMRNAWAAELSVSLYLQIKKWVKD